MKYVITGGCGFIGTNLTKYLLEVYEDIEIVLVDNLSVGKKENVHPEAKFIWSDVEDMTVAMEVCEGADVVIHLAAEPGVIPSIEDPDQNFNVNTIGTFTYLEASRRQNVGRFVFASSGAVLGNQHPPVDEDMLPNPMSPYGASKLTGEAYCSAYYHSFGLDTVALRFANAYGPYSEHKESIIPKFIKYALDDRTFSIYGDGKQTRDLIFVGDLVRAIVSASAIAGVGGEVFQVATGKAFTVLEVVERLKMLCEERFFKKPEVIFEPQRPGEIIDYYCSVSKAAKMLDWKASYKLDLGLSLTVEWFEFVKETNQKEYL